MVVTRYAETCYYVSSLLFWAVLPGHLIVQANNAPVQPAVNMSSSGSTTGTELSANQEVYAGSSSSTTSVSTAQSSAQANKHAPSNALGSCAELDTADETDLKCACCKQRDKYNCAGPNTSYGSGRYVYMMGSHFSAGLPNKHAPGQFPRTARGFGSFGGISGNSNMVFGARRQPGWRAQLSRPCTSQQGGPSQVYVGLDSFLCDMVLRPAAGRQLG